jgi:hypothetical protein
VQYSQRRYDQWLGCVANDAGCAMRQFFVQNRDQTKAYMNVEVQVTKDVTVTPNGGVRWIEYPTDAVWNGLGGNAPTPPKLTNSLGTQYDRGWNAGADLSVRITPELRATVGYNYEEHYLYMQSCCGGSYAFNNSTTWTSQVVQRYNTVVASALWNAIPGKLDILGDYVYAFGTEANNTNGCSSANVNPNCAGLNSFGPTPIWPTEQNKLQRFNVVAKYYVDPSVVKQMGFVGNITLKARYTWEQNKADNWAINDFTPYSPSAADAGGGDITNGGRSLFLAYNNPNYTAQIVALSVVGQW